MNREQFGRLVAALRKEHYDEYGAVWTQAKLAQMADLSEPLIGNVERGSKTNLEQDLLLKLAQALNLTTGERHEFFAAASGMSADLVSRNDEQPEQTRDALLEIMGQLQLPAMLFDVFSDTLAINRAAAVVGNAGEMFADQVAVPKPLLFNSVYLYFAPEYDSSRRLLRPEQERFAYRMLMNFRVASLRYRAHPYFRYLLSQLMHSATFRIYWQQVHLVADDHLMDTLPMMMQHPQLGGLEFAVSTMSAMTKCGALRLQCFTPLSAATAVKFQALMRDGGGQMISMAAWPRKVFPGQDDWSEV